MPKATYRPMTQDEITIIKAMRVVSYPSFTYDNRMGKSFRSRVWDAPPECSPIITERESSQLWRLSLRYRRQWKHPEKARLLKLARQFHVPKFRTKEQRRLENIAFKLKQALKQMPTETLAKNQPELTL